MVLPIKSLAEYDEHFVVQTDIAEAVGAKEFVLFGKGTSNYRLQILPRFSGQIAGSVQLLNQTVQHNDYWFDIEIDVNKATLLQEFSVESGLRVPAEIEIPLENTSAERIEVGVRVESVEELHFDPDIVMLRGENLLYKIVWIPRKVGATESVICFTSLEAGEKRYLMKLKTAEGKVTKMPLVVSELGKTECIQITLENPSSGAAQL